MGVVLGDAPGAAQQHARAPVGRRGGARARRYMRKPVTINIGSAGKETDNVTQHIIIAKDNDKPRLLEDWINEARAARSVLPYPNPAAFARVGGLPGG